MNFLKFFSPFGIVFLSINYATEVTSEKALIYDYATGLSGRPGRLVELQNVNDLQACKTCIIACPASSKPEKEFDKDDSLTGNSVFLRKTDSNLQIDICDEQFRPGLIWDENKKIYITGYELYYDEHQINLQSDQYDNFRKVPIAEIFNSNQDIQNIDMRQYYKEQRPSSNRVNRYKNRGNTIFEILDGSPIPQKWVFFFIRILVIRGQAYTRQITLADRDVIINSDKPDGTMTECLDYNFGNGDPTSKTELESIPPEQEDQDTQTIPLLSKSCTNLDNCLEKTQILPMFFFQTFASKLATCTHLNIALIPKIIANKQLKKVDQYLYTIRRIWLGTTVLTFGVKKVVLKWQATSSTHGPAPEALPQDFPTVELLHSPGSASNLRDLPTAEIVFRLVQYVANQRVYQALIVIHTDLTTTPDNSARICSQQSELQGWDRITNEDSETGFTYVCPLTKEIIRSLELAANFTGFDFQLNKFPIRTGNLYEEMPIKDVTEEIDNKLKYFIDKGILERI